MKIRNIIAISLLVILTNALTFFITQTINKRNIQNVIDDMNKVKEEYLQGNADKDLLQKEINTLQGNLEKGEQQSVAQDNCIKMNGLKMLRSDIVIRTSGESGGNGCGPSEATNSITREIEQTYNYVKGWRENYENTGMEVWKHSPDVCKYDVERYWGEIEKQYNEYMRYKSLCNQQ